MASFSDEDILVICDKIFEKLGVNYELEDLGILLVENIYIELYRIMFPYLEAILVEIATKKTDPGHKIQDLIDLLSSTVLNMDLSHIKGDNIAKGDKKHILNFLQLLFEVIKLLPTPTGNEIAIHSAPLTEHSSQKNSINRRKTVQGILDEFPSVNFDQDNPENGSEQEIDKGYEQDAEIDQNYIEQPTEDLKGNFQEENEEEQDMGEKEEEGEEGEEGEEVEEEEEGEEGENPIETSKNIIKEAPKSEESSEYGNKQHYGKVKRKSNGNGKLSSEKQEFIDNNEKKMLRDKSKKNLVEDIYVQKQIHKKLIGETLFTGKTTKILKKDQPQTLKLKKTTGNKGEGKARELIGNSIHSEKKQESVKSGNSENRKELKDQNVEFLKFNENMYEILADNIEKIRESLRNMKSTNLTLEDQKTKEQLIRQKNEYKRLLQDYLQYHKIKESQSKVKGEKDEKFFLNKLQQLQSKDTTFQHIIDNEEKGLYMKLRDEKINYLRKIHRIIFELEKRKIIDENKQYKDNRRLRNEETRYVLESVENAYKDKINMLKEKLIAQRKEKTVSETAHRHVLSKLERELKQEKQKQLNELKDTWRCEKEKFDLMVMDDGNLEQKIMALYNKY